MLIIHHRRNSIELINQTQINFGVEIDIRSNNNKLVLGHDIHEENEDIKGVTKSIKKPW